MKTLSVENDGKTLTIYMKPVAAVRMTRSDHWKRGEDQRPAVARYWDFKDTLVQLWPEGYRLSPIFSCTFIIPMPESWSEKKKQQMDGMPHQQKPDTDNLVKAVKDALCEDDSYIWKYRDIEKRWGREGMIKFPIKDEE